MSDNELNISKNKQEQVFKVEQASEQQEELYGNTYLEDKREFFRNHKAMGFFGRYWDSKEMKRVKNASKAIVNLMKGEVPKDLASLHASGEALIAAYENLITQCRSYQDIKRRKGTVKYKENLERHQAVADIKDFALHESTQLRGVINDLEERISAGDDLAGLTWQQVLRDVRTVDVTNNPNVQVQRSKDGATSDLLLLKIREQKDEKGKVTRAGRDVFFKKSSQYNKVTSRNIFKAELKEWKARANAEEDLDRKKELEEQYELLSKFGKAVFGVFRESDAVTSFCCYIAAYKMEALKEGPNNVLDYYGIRKRMEKTELWKILTTDTEKTFRTLEPVFKKINMADVEEAVKTSTGTKNTDKNVATSILSEIYGNKDQIAQCILMKVKQNGEEIEGYALETVKGRSLASVYSELIKKNKPIRKHQGDYIEAWNKHFAALKAEKKSLWDVVNLTNEKDKLEKEFREKYEKDNEKALGGFKLVAPKSTKLWKVEYTDEVMIKLQDQQMFDYITGDCDHSNEGNMMVDGEFDQEKCVFRVTKVKFIDHDLSFGALTPADLTEKVINSVPLQDELGNFDQPYIAQTVYDHIMNLDMSVIRLRLGHLFSNPKVLNSLEQRLNALKNMINEGVRNLKIKIVEDKDFGTKYKKLSKTKYSNYFNKKR